jgi:type IV secretory pathway TrbL component
MSLKLFSSPSLPLAPSTYDPEYFNQVIRALNTYFRQLDSTTPIVVDSITLLALPTNAIGQRVGTVYNDNGVLKIVLAGNVNGVAGAVNLVGAAPRVFNGNVVPTSAVTITGIAPTITVA